MIEAEGFFIGPVQSDYLPQNVVCIMMRQLATAGVVAAAVGGPYVATETDLGKSVTNQLKTVLISTDGTNAITPSNNQLGNAHYATESLWDRKLDERHIKNFSGEAFQPLAGGPIPDFRDVLRFDITPDWVASHFARVTTVLSELQLEGMRVPIVTGTRSDDIAGSVTYYFRYDGRLQRVVLHGFTGDPNRLVKLMQEHYHMQPRASLDTGVYTADWNGRPASVLKVTRAPVLYADAKLSQHTVFLELNQPTLDYGLSLEAQRIVGADWSTGRW